METLHTISEYKTAFYFTFFDRQHAILQMNCTTVRTTFLASRWPTICYKTDKDVQLGIETDGDTQAELKPLLQHNYW